MIRTVFSLPRRARRAEGAPRTWRRLHTMGREIVLEAGSRVADAERDVLLVQGDDGPLPALQSDDDRLLIRFSFHLEGLVRALDAGSGSAVGFDRARRLGRLPPPLGYLDSRLHPVMAAESTQELLARIAPEGVAASLRPRVWGPPGVRAPHQPSEALWAPDREEAHV
ncbi:hypothetical protein [Streptomyces sp. NPDC046988]|uniref:hypothetical protein n=1 Tax=Streptomyces sp. NPDC046988 TaxID=3154922 RepID=UPI0033C77467